MTYGCRQSAMITSWRKYFGVPSAFFGLVIMEPWIGGPSPGFRTVQYESVTALQQVGYAIASDIGDPTGPFGSVHPRNKKLVGRRLANAALSMQYGMPMNYQAPMYASATASAAGTTVTVAVSFTNVPTTLVAAQDHCQTELGVPASQCFYFTILGSDSKLYNVRVARARVRRDAVKVSARCSTHSPSPPLFSRAQACWCRRTRT